MCHLVKWMAEEGKVRRVVEVQKGGCEDASEILNLSHFNSIPYYELQLYNS